MGTSSNGRTPGWQSGNEGPIPSVSTSWVVRPVAGLRTPNPDMKVRFLHGPPPELLGIWQARPPRKRVSPRDRLWAFDPPQLLHGEMTEWQGASLES